MVLQALKSIRPNPFNLSHCTIIRDWISWYLNGLSKVCELWTSRCSSWIQKRQRNQRSNCQHLPDHRKREFQKNIYFCFIDYAKAFGYVNHNKLENYQRDGSTRPPDLPLEKLVCRSGSNGYNWTWNNTLVPNRKRSTSRLYIVTLLI